jgi:hypothetical protein
MKKQPTEILTESDLYKLEEEYAASKDISLFIKGLQKLTRLYKRRGDISWSQACLMALAHNAWLAGNPEKCYRLRLSYVKQYPDHIYGWVDLMRIERCLGRINRSLAVVPRALALAESQENAKHKIAAILFQAGISARFLSDFKLVTHYLDAFLGLNIEPVYGADFAVARARALFTETQFKLGTIPPVAFFQAIDDISHSFNDPVIHAVRAVAAHAMSDRRGREKWRKRALEYVSYSIGAPLISDDWQLPPIILRQLPLLEKKDSCNPKNL